MLDEFGSESEPEIKEGKKEESDSDDMYITQKSPKDKKRKRTIANKPFKPPKQIRLILNLKYKSYLFYLAMSCQKKRRRKSQS